MQLGPHLQQIAQQLPARSRWGMVVRSLADNQTLFAHEGDRFFIPASNGKLFTTAAALTHLGATYRIRTSVYRVAATGTVLHVVGRGDPSLTDVQLQDLAKQLRDRGVSQIDRLIVDDTYFRGDPINPNWEWEDLQAGYGAPVNSLIVNHNELLLTLIPQALGQPLQVQWQDPTAAAQWRVVNQSRTVEATAAEFTQAGGNPIHRVVTIQGQLRVGAAPAQEAIAVVNPTENFAQRFRHALAAQDLPVLRLEFATTPSQPSEADEVAAITSPPLVALLTAANQDSENIYAEALLRTLGAVTSPQATEMATETETTTLTAGLTAVQQILSRLGVDPRSYALADGAGLARKNLASPEALVQTLVAIAHTPQATAFRNTLAVAGRSGTLKNRFRGTPLEGKLWGKTGAISGIATLSGYLNPPDHPPLAFSLLVNHFDQPVRTIRPIIDEMVLQVGQLRPCPP